MAEYINKEELKQAVRDKWKDLEMRVEVNCIVNEMPIIDIVYCHECKYKDSAINKCRKGYVYGYVSNDFFLRRWKKERIMKIELEVNAKQMESISKDLSTFLTTLTDEQKIEIIQGFANTQLDDILNRNTSGYYSGYYTGDFTRTFADSLNKNIEEAVVKYFSEREDIIEKFKDNIQKIEDNFDNICMQAISKFIADNILIHKQEFAEDVMFKIRNANCR